MGVREQIMKIPCPPNKLGHHIALKQSVDIAEDRERELLAEINELQISASKLIYVCNKLEAEKAALIAELRGLPRYCLQSCTALDEVLDKYEAKP